MAHTHRCLGTAQVSSSFPETMKPQGTSQQPFSSLPTTTSTPPRGRSPWQSNNPFVILPLSARVKKCAGCPFSFRDPMGMGPPFIGLVIQQKETDFYHDKTGAMKISTEVNHYYHCQFSCIIKRHPYFHARLLQLGPATLTNTAQANELCQQFGLNV